MCDFQIDPRLLEIDIPDCTEELDELLAELAKDPVLPELGKDAGPGEVNLVEMRARHREGGRLLQRAGLEFFARKGKRPPKCA